MAKPCWKRTVSSLIRFTFRPTCGSGRSSWSSTTRTRPSGRSRHGLLQGTSNSATRTRSWSAGRGRTSSELQGRIPPASCRKAKEVGVEVHLDVEGLQHDPVRPKPARAPEDRAGLARTKDNSESGSSAGGPARRCAGARRRPGRGAAKYSAPENSSSGAEQVGFKCEMPGGRTSPRGPRRAACSQRRRGVAVPDSREHVAPWTTPGLPAVLVTIAKDAPRRGCRTCALVASEGHDPAGRDMPKSH